MSCPGREALDACAAGELAAERAAAVDSHAAQCVACGKRLAWLRRENQAIRSWAAQDEGDLEPLWGGIQARLAQKPAQRRWGWTALPAAAAALVAAMLVLHGRAPLEEEMPSTAAAIARAEADYAGAVATLEAQVSARHPPAGRHESALSRALSRTRSGLATARASAGDEPAGRVRLLEGYAAYLKSLRRALQDDQP